MYAVLFYVYPCLTAVAIKRIPTGINLRKRMKSYFPKACLDPIAAREASSATAYGASTPKT